MKIGHYTAQIQFVPQDDPNAPPFPTNAEMENEIATALQSLPGTPTQPPTVTVT